MLNYVEDNLVEEEKLIYLGRRSIIEYSTQFTISIVFILLAGAGVYRLGLNLYSLAAVGVTVFCLAQSWLRWKATEFGITSKRLIYKSGILSVETWEMQLSKANKLSLSQSIAGRVLNFGTITVSDSGNDSCSFTNMDNPAEFRQCYLAATDHQPAQKTS